MGGGILPVSIYKGEVYFLFGRESRHIDHKASGLWSDFGGTKEKKRKKNGYRDKRRMGRNRGSFRLI